MYDESCLKVHKIKLALPLMYLKGILPLPRGRQRARFSALTIKGTIHLARSVSLESLHRIIGTVEIRDVNEAIVLFPLKCELWGT